MTHPIDWIVVLGWILVPALVATFVRGWWPAVALGAVLLVSLTWLLWGAGLLEDPLWPIAIPTLIVYASVWSAGVTWLVHRRKKKQTRDPEHAASRPNDH
jgi:hypothetical protein